MEGRPSATGISRMWARKGLVFLIYGLGLTVAALVASGVFRLLEVVVDPTGFSEHLLDRFDIIVWADLWRELGPGLAAIARQAALAGGIMMVWKIASSVGLIHALHGDGRSSFWEGVSRFTFKGLGLGLLYLIPLLVLLVLAVVVGELMASSYGEVGAFWMRFAVIPLVVILLAAMFDLYHDYARMHLVLRGATIRRAWIRGFVWPFTHPGSVALYGFWFLLSVILWIAVLLVGFYMPDQSIGAVLLAFLIQQVLVICRTGAYVSWIGAEVAFFEERAVLVSDEVVDESEGDRALQVVPETHETPGAGRAW